VNIIKKNSGVKYFVYFGALQTSFELSYLYKSMTYRCCTWGNWHIFNWNWQMVSKSG